MSLLDFFPYPEARDVQAELLEKLEAAWRDHDVFVIEAPTATGKSAIMRAIAGWTEAAALLSPTNVLLDQLVQEFPTQRCLRREDLYHCQERGDLSCKQFARYHDGGHCHGCHFQADLWNAIGGLGSVACNYHMYLARRLHRPVLVVDEAHNLLPVIQDMEARVFWKHVVKYPDRVRSPADVKTWLEEMPVATRRKSKRLSDIWAQVSSPAPTAILEVTTRRFNGKGTRRGFPEDLPCILLKPVDVADARPLFWPSDIVKKVVLLSATIGAPDVKLLGLDRRRVAFFRCSSPILPGRRPTISRNLASVNRHSFESATLSIARHIEEAILPAFPSAKGVIHATYQQAEFLRGVLRSPRFLFHSKENKQAVYQQFRDSDPAVGRVLVASGLYEGIDLPNDLGRFQVIAKIPWASLADAAVKYRAETDPAWYTWNTLKTVIQACGRICRTPEDTGTTFILDGTFRKLYSEAKEHQLVPSWWEEAITWEEQK